MLGEIKRACKQQSGAEWVSVTASGRMALSPLFPQHAQHTNWCLLFGCVFPTSV